MEFCEILINKTFNQLWHKNNNTMEIRANGKMIRKSLDRLFDLEYLASNCRKQSRNISDVRASETL